jgi:hypothetical protein
LFLKKDCGVNRAKVGNAPLKKEPEARQNVGKKGKKAVK